MSWSNPVKNKKMPEPKGGWTKDDRAARCINCFVKGPGGEAFRSDDGSAIGTVLSLIIVKVSYPDKPFDEVAKAVICRGCHRLYQVRLLAKAHELDISQAAIEACLKASNNADSFKLSELYSGRLETVELSPTLKEILARRPRTAPAEVNSRTGIYNPDAFIEQQQSELPL